MATKLQQEIADIEFVFTETARIQQQLKSDLRSISTDDHMFALPAPDGSSSRHLICGRKAGERLERLARGAASRAGITRRVAREAVVEAVADEIVRRFIRDGHELNSDEVDKGLSSAGKTARAHCRVQTHFLPCHLMFSKEPDRIEVGPVCFHRPRSFARRILPPARAYKATLKESDGAWPRELLARALRHYREFDWVAEVTVGRCDPKLARPIASRAVTSALDCLHLVLGRQGSRRMCVAGPALSVETGASLLLSSAGDLTVSLSRRGAGQVGFEAGWSDILLDSVPAEVVRRFGLLLETAIDPDLDRPLSRRFLDAAQWYGEAVRDESPATAIVKYATAIERLVNTGRSEHVQGDLKERVAALCFRVPDAADRAIWERRAAATYDLRSKLVHGAISPADERVIDGARDASEIAQTCIVSALVGLREEHFTSKGFNAKALAEWFRQLIGRCDSLVRDSVSTTESDPSHNS
jgi:hypothetical protein